MGFAIQRMSTWSSCLAGLALLTIAYQFVLQASWKRASQPANDPWIAEQSAVNSQTKLLYVLGVIGLYLIAIYCALATLLFPAYMDRNIVKIGVGLVMADQCIRVARRRTVVQATSLDQTGSMGTTSMGLISPDAVAPPPSPDQMTRDAMVVIGLAVVAVACLSLVLVIQPGKVDYQEVAAAGAVPVVAVLGWAILRKMK